MYEIAMFINYLGTISDGLGVFGIILVAGAFGGCVRCYWERLSECETNDPVKANAAKPWLSTKRECATCTAHLLMGIAGAFSVPLLLAVLGGSLVKDALQNTNAKFTLAAYCIVAAIFAKRLLSALADKTLKEIEKKAEKATGTAEAAKDAADKAEKAAEAAMLAGEKAEKAIRKTYFHDGLAAARAGRFPEAIVSFKSFLVAEARNDYAQAMLAYCAKRTGDYHLALKAINLACEIEPSYWKWAYNRSSYSCLVGVALSEVVELLRIAWVITPEGDRKDFCDELQKDSDFVRIKESEEFKDFLRSLPIQ